MTESAFEASPTETNAIHTLVLPEEVYVQANNLAERIALELPEAAIDSLDVALDVLATIFNGYQCSQTAAQLEKTNTDAHVRYIEEIEQHCRESLEDWEPKSYN